MSTTRRDFLTAGLTTAVAGAAITTASAADPKEPALIDGLTCLDYGRSFVCNTAAFNAVRFWVESRTVLFDGNRQVEFLQCGSCKSENTFGEKDLFLANNYDFLPIIGDGNYLIFRRTANLNTGYRQLRTLEGSWGPAEFKLRAARRVTVLDTWEKIRDATAAAQPIVSRTELTHTESGLKAVIECPVKTMNVSLNLQKYQIDTGPIAFPDLSQRFEPRIDCLKLAFVAFNAPHFADFVVEQPTPVIEDGVERCQIHHYSNPISLPARNTLLAVEDV
jgi:hypothetical protein